MMASRFRSVVLAASAAATALGCYMVSLKVASERNELARVERAIARADNDIRYLQTEIGTRARLTQLERWNADVLALAAPASSQYLKSEVQLASFSGGRGLPGVIRPDGLPAIPASQPSATPNVVTASYAPPAPPPAAVAAIPKAHVIAAAAAVVAAAESAPALRHATYIKPVDEPRIEKVALIDDRVMSEILRAAKTEASRSKAAR